MKQYLDLMQKILDEGTPKSDRTGTGTRSIFGHQMRFNLQDGFPLVTTKRCHLRSIIHELLWFLKGDTNIGYLRDNNVTIWDEWADENGGWGRYMESSGAHGALRTVVRSIRFPLRLSKSSAIRIHGGSSFPRGTSANCQRWRWRPATRSSSSTLQTASYPASCISAPVTFFWGCRLTLPAMRCWYT